MGVLKRYTTTHTRERDIYIYVCVYVYVVVVVYFLTSLTGDKILKSLDDLKDITFRVLDPGCHQVYAAVDFLTNEADIRMTKMILTTAGWRKRIKADNFQKRQMRRHKEVSLLQYIFKLYMKLYIQQGTWKSTR